MATEKNVAQAESQLKHYDMTSKHLMQELKVKSNEMKKSEAEYQKNAKNEKGLENEVKQLQNQLGEMHYDEARVNELEQLQRKLRGELTNLKDRIDAFEAQFPNLNFRYTPPDRNFNKESVKGNAIFNLAI